MYYTYPITFQAPAFLNNIKTSQTYPTPVLQAPAHLWEKDTRQLMSSLEIAEATGKRHDNVLRDITKMAEDLSLKFEEKSQDSSGGRPTKVLMLNKRASLILVTGYSTAMRAAVIDRWQHLETTQAVAVPKTYGEALKAAAEAEIAREMLALENQRKTELLFLAAPKVEAYEQFLEAEGLYVPKQIAALFPDLKLNAQKVNLLLKDWGWQVKQGKRWHPNQVSINNGWLVSKVFTTESGFSGSQLHVTNAGLEEIRCKLRALKT